jgi:hypothetical protein
MPHYGKSGLPNELLHEVNNQFEIVVSTAERERHSFQPALSAVTEANMLVVVDRA